MNHVDFLYGMRRLTLYFPRRISVEMPVVIEAHNLPTTGRAARTLYTPL